MNTEEIDKLKEVIRLAALGELHPFKMNSEVLTPPPPEGEFQVNCELAVEVRAPSFLVVGRLMIHGQSQGKVDYLKMEIGVLARYDLPIEFPMPDPLLLAEFAKRNGMLHIWPLFRVLVLSTCSQLGIPPVMIPLSATPAAASDSTPPATGEHQPP